MDRIIPQVDQAPLVEDHLNTNRNTMVAIGYLFQALAGSNTIVDGLACTPLLTGIGVNIGPGLISQLTTIDQNSYGVLSADQISPLIKLGINTSNTSFNLSVPQVAGQTTNYLIEALFLEVDDQELVLPFYDSANPTVSFSGPGGAGGATATRRRQSVQLQLKAGVSANTGTQATPGVDAGWTGLYVISVNNGETAILQSNINVYPNAPFIGTKVPSLAPIYSPALTGVPTAPTAPINDNSNTIATTAFATRVAEQVAAGVSGSLLGYVTDSQLTTDLSNYVTNSALATDLSNYVTNSALAADNYANIPYVDSHFDYSCSDGLNGFARVNNILFVWGVMGYEGHPTAISSVTDIQINFPIAFPSTCFQVMFTGMSTGDEEGQEMGFGINWLSNTGVSVHVIRLTGTDISLTEYGSIKFLAIGV